MGTYFAALWASLIALLPTILIAIVVLVVGIIVAYLLSSLVRSVLRRTHLEDRLAQALKGSENPRPENIKIESWTAGIVFWLVVFFAIVAALQILNLNAISGPLSGILTSILDFIPRLISAGILLVVAWLIATLLRMVVTRVLNASGAVRSASENAEVRPQDRVSVAQAIGNVVYWLVFLLFLPAILGALNLQGILGPVQTMVNNLLAYLPNILGAAAVFFIGYFVARIVRQIVVSLLSSAGLDNFGRRAGLGDAADRVSLSDVIGWIVYVMILIPVIIAALNALNIPAVSTPASNMLNTILTALPNIFAAFLILVVAYFIGRLLGRFVAALLAGVGFNHFFERIGVYHETPANDQRAQQQAQRAVSDATGGAAAPQVPVRTTPADIVGYLVTVGVLLFAAMEAAQFLAFAFLATLISSFIVVVFQVAVGLAIFALGLYLSSWADRTIRDTGMAQANILAPAARAAIIIFSAALALRQMGIAASIVNLAFGLLLGAVAVAAAIAFGLGGRDFARNQLSRWEDNINANSLIPNTGNEAQRRQQQREREKRDQEMRDQQNRNQGGVPNTGSPNMGNPNLGNPNMGNTGFTEPDLPDTQPYNPDDPEATRPGNLDNPELPPG